MRPLRATRSANKTLLARVALLPSYSASDMFVEGFESWEGLPVMLATGLASVLGMELGIFDGNEGVVLVNVLWVCLGSIITISSSVYCR